MSTPRNPVPRDSGNDHTAEAAAMRREFASAQSGSSLDHVGSFSVDPATLPGNIESFTGVAQVPIGLAGPLLVNGEHAQGDFYVPMATTEGTLVASYNRGMKLLRAAGGVNVTVVDEAMQRAPAFLFGSAREARDFVVWLDAHFDEIKGVAESTTGTGKLRDIQRFVVSRFVYTRFNYTTGDAAGQNMTSKATWAACEWIKGEYAPLSDYMLEAQLATDKKHSHMNTLHTRGKRVVAEALIPDALLREHMRVTSKQVYRARQISTVGGILAGAAANAAHPANGIAAMYIATGQDAGNVAESQAAIAYVELRENDDYYYSLTLPSLIVATHGGGTGLATQRECLELLGCFGDGKAHKLAEIVAATVVCGELSLGSAVVADEFVAAHDKLGRNH
ncbi:MAG: hydroxymethylglutaryl-CoA reductase [Solirubrobacterales bacterium]|nr:hydroxymethylglutaryl-CoA reductase [Solirubrobacterales bacterium]